MMCNKVHFQKFLAEHPWVERFTECVEQYMLRGIGTRWSFAYVDGSESDVGGARIEVGLLAKVGGEDLASTTQFQVELIEKSHEFRTYVEAVVQSCVYGIARKLLVPPLREEDTDDR